MATMGTAAALFATLLTDGPQSRDDLAGRLGITAAAVTRAAGPLLDAGYLTASARPAARLAVRSGREFFVGVAVTPDEMVGAVCDLAARVHLVERRALRGIQVGEVLDDLDAIIATMLSRGGYRSRTRRLGLAVPGETSADGWVVRAPLLRWQDVPLLERAGQRTGLTVTVANDADALAAAERWFGEGPPAYAPARAAAAVSVQQRVLSLA